MDTPYQLYLSKNEEMVYVDEVPHHRDGIRFLYRQYKKKKPGVIVNDPLKSIREVQIVLFIKAVCYLLTKPVLVMCHKDDENGWLDLFRNWTDLGDDVVIETTKPYLKKKVIINPMVNLPLFSIQEWSMVVVDGDISSSVLGYPFKADFKIWSISINMKENLEAFSSIYSWLTQKFKSKYQCEKFNISEFVADKNNIKDVIEKAILLDAFMEDIVIRRDELACKEDLNVCSTPKILSRKNKDVTGTKIKRSKRRIDNTKEICQTTTQSVEPIVPKIRKSEDIGNVAKDDVLDQGKDNDDPNFTEPCLRELCNDFNVNTVNSQEMNLIYETDSITHSDKIYEMDTLVAEEFSDIVPIDENKETANVDMDCDVDEMNSNRIAESKTNDNIYEILNRDNHGKWKLTKLLIQDTFNTEMNMKYKNSVEDYSENIHEEARKQINDTYSNELNVNNITSENEILHTKTINEISNENQINMSVISDNSKVNNLTSDTESKMNFLYKDKLKYDINSKNEIKANEGFTQGKTNVVEADDNITHDDDDKNSVEDCSENNHEEARKQINNTYSNELNVNNITSENEILHTKTININEISNENQINIAVISDNSKVNNLTSDTESKMNFLYKDKLKYDINSKNEIKANEVFTQGKTNVVEADDNICKTENTRNDVIQRDFRDIDHKNNQAIEKATKRFKGSILDSLF